MYRILYHGRDRADFARIRTEIPKRYNLTQCLDRKSLQERIRPGFNGGIILPLSNPQPAEYGYLRELVSMPRSAGVVVTASNLSVQQAVSCMRMGAFDCLHPSADGKVIATVLDRMLTGSGICAGTDNNDGHPGDNDSFIGNSNAIREMKSRARLYAEQEHPVLITGETGTGKELVAGLIHDSSSRRNGPFMAVNCAAYQDELIGTELFGSRSGAFTGSVDRPGLFESARRGSVFLDEIGELSLQGQACLLRVVEEKKVRRLGSMKTVDVDVRILAATNRPLQEMIREKRFRPDLYYRLNLLGLSIPPLRKRVEDIPEIARDYLIRLGSCKHLDSPAIALLARHAWPGNVRELHTVLLRAALNCRNSTIRASDIRLT